MTEPITYTARVYMNVGEDHFMGYQPRHPIAAVSWSMEQSEPMGMRPFPWRVRTEHGEQAAAEMMFTIGNRMGCDYDGRHWPSDIRSLSVGDLVSLVNSDGTPGMTFLAVASMGYDDVPEPTNPRVPIEGTEATSREAKGSNDDE